MKVEKTIEINRSLTNYKHAMRDRSEFENQFVNTLVEKGSSCFSSTNFLIQIDGSHLLENF